MPRILATRNHALARVVTVLFGISTLFPIVAGLLREDQRPRWCGALDVVVAAALVIWWSLRH